MRKRILGTIATTLTQTFLNGGGISLCRNSSCCSNQRQWYSHTSAKSLKQQTPNPLLSTPDGKVFAVVEQSKTLSCICNTVKDEKKLSLLLRLWYPQIKYYTTLCRIEVAIGPAIIVISLLWYPHESQNPKPFPYMLL